MAAPPLPATQLIEILDAPVRAHRIDLVGAVALPHELDHGPDYLAWLSNDHHARLDYMCRDPEDRLDPTRQRPWAATMLVFGQRYVNGWAPDDEEAAAGCGEDRPWSAGVSRYARGDDYHDILRGSIRRITVHLRDDLHRRGVIASAGDLQCVDAVDAGPYLEREYAWLAGFGFFGKNTLLIHPRLGSGLFLGIALTNLRITGLPDTPRPLLGPSAQPKPGGAAMASLCGTCTACLDACPTSAFPRPFVLDANQCLSAWTIEWRGGAPADRRHEQGGRLFGCDICQQVCPWNHKAARLAMDQPRDEYAVSSAHAEIDLSDLIRVDADTYRARFRRSPLWRAHPEGMRRNALVVAANTGRRDLVPVIRTAAADDPDADVRAVARWALTELEGDA